MPRKSKAQIAKEKAEADGKQTAAETEAKELDTVIEVDIPKVQAEAPAEDAVEEKTAETSGEVTLEKQTINRAPIPEPASVMRVEIVMRAAGYHPGEIHELDGETARGLIARKIAIRSV